VSELFAGIDGGQSSTLAVIGDEGGRILGRGTAGPADEVGGGTESTKLSSALRGALEGAWRNAGYAVAPHFAGVVAGVSGYDGRVYGAAPQLPAQRFSLVHDAPAAHAGALAGLPGVVVIAGTGSVVYARDDRGAEATYGGWGFLFGDEGSAFWLAREALATMMRAADAGDAALDAETRAARIFFAVDSLRGIARAFYAGEIPRERIAAFAPVALSFAAFRTIADRGIAELAGLTCQALETMVLQRVALCGGVFADSLMYDGVARAIVARCPQARIEPAKYEPAAGALLLAYREAGLHVTELTV
jgi:N-acetylglucosamine kinase-like BadF-type ATPase